MERLDLFDKYIKNALSDQEKVAFDDRVRGDSIFNSEYYEFLAMQQFLVAKPRIAEGKEIIQKLRSEYAGSTSTKGTQYSIFKIILGIIALIGLLYFMWPKQDSLPNTIPLESEPLPLISEPISIPVTKPTYSIFTEDRNKYDLFLDTVGLSDVAIPFTLFVNGTSALQDEKVQEGRSILETLASEHPLFADDAYWQIALSYLDVDDLTTVRDYLSKISVDGELRYNADHLMGLLE